MTFNSILSRFHLLPLLTTLAYLGKLVILNSIEKNLEKIRNPTTRYWLLLKEYENCRRSDLSIFAKKKRGPYKKKNVSKIKKNTFRWKK